MGNSGIYTITSPSGGVYVGSTVNFDRRWKIHRRELRVGTHHSAALQSAWNKYGAEQMEFEVLVRCSIDDLIREEQKAIDLIKPKYNMCPAAGSRLGFKASEETRAKLSVSNSGKTMPAHVKALLIKTNIGKKDSDEVRLKKSIAALGVKKSDAARIAMSVAQTGLKRDRAVVEKIAAKLRGIPRTAELKAKLSEKLKGRRIREWTEEEKAKVSATLKAFHAAKRSV